MDRKQRNSELVTMRAMTAPSLLELSAIPYSKGRNTFIARGCRVLQNMQVQEDQSVIA